MVFISLKQNRWHVTFSKHKRKEKIKTENSPIKIQKQSIMILLRVRIIINIIRYNDNQYLMMIINL